MLAVMGTVFFSPGNDLEGKGDAGRHNASVEKRYKAGLSGCTFRASQSVVSV